MEIIKRNGTKVDFDINKIISAVSRANKEAINENQLNKNEIIHLSKNVEQYIKDKQQEVDVEYIQDIVEKEIMKFNAYEVAQKYIKYRYNRQLIRKANTTDQSILSLIKNDNKEVMEENSNKNAIIASTQRDLIAGEVSKDLTKRMLLPERITRAHELGILHFHDADYFLQPIFNCCLINIGDMLDNGTVMNNKLVESPKSFQVACTVMTQIIAAVASSQYGGQSVDISHLGKYLRKSYNKYKAKIIRKYGNTIDKELVESLVNDRIKDELKAGVQTIQYQINTLMTTNGLIK